MDRIKKVTGWMLYMMVDYIVWWITFVVTKHYFYKFLFDKKL